MPTNNLVDEWLKADDLDDIIRAADPHERIAIVEGLARRGNSKDLIRLIRTIETDDDDIVAQRAVDVLCNPLGTDQAYFPEDVDDQPPSMLSVPQAQPPPPRLFFDDPFALRELTRALRSAHGVRYGLLAEVLSICKPEQVRQALVDLGAQHCSMVADGRCIKQDDIRVDNTIFVAHHYAPAKMRWLRPAIANALRAINDQTGSSFIPFYADTRFRTGHILCAICARIQSSAAAIFDLESPEPRANVALELGLGYGFRKKCITLIRRGQEPQSDIAGFQRVEYSSYADLESQLVQALPDVLSAEP